MVRYSDYYNRKGVDWDNYSYSLSAMGQVPDFEYQRDIDLIVTFMI